MAKKQEFSENEITYILNNTHLGASELSRQLDKNRPRIAKIIKQNLGLDRLNYQPELIKQDELQFILDNKDILTSQEIGNRIGRSHSFVLRRIHKYCQNHSKSVGYASKLTQDDLNFIKQNYNSYSNDEFCTMFNLHVNTLIYWKNKLNIPKYSGKRTSIENIISNSLKSLGYDFKEQVTFSKWRADFYIESINVIIETHGDYWHANPKIYNTENSNNIQIYNFNRDQIKYKYLKSIGCKLCILWETDIKQNIGSIDAYLASHIARCHLE
jgi:G:T-mismatch repair DNA endonuclease (very short patch repair protein)